jgi:hypothetical protein
VYELEVDPRVRQGEDSEDLIGERLTDRRDSREVEVDRAKQIDPSQHTLGLRAGDQGVFGALGQDYRDDDSAEVAILAGHVLIDHFFAVRVIRLRGRIRTAVAFADWAAFQPADLPLPSILTGPCQWSTNYCRAAERPTNAMTRVGGVVTVPGADDLGDIA